jgi:putative membrane protein
MLYRNWLALLLFSALLPNCGTGQRDPVAEAKSVNEDRISDADVTKRQERDAEFLVDAASSSLLVSRLNQLAQQKATQPAIRNLAQTLVRGHAGVDAALRTVAGQKGIQLPADLGSKEQDTYADLAKLTGPEFDQQYLKTVADGHDDAADEFEDMAEDAYDGDIRAFAAKYAPTFKQHYQDIKQVQDNLQP